MSDAQRQQRETLLREAIVAGHAWAWTELYEGSYDGLRRYVAWRAGRVESWTDEVVQQTWLVAVGEIRRFDPQRASFATWLRGIAGNVLRARLRRWARDERRRRPLDAAEAVAEGSEVAPIDHGEALGVARALAALSADYERVLRGKYLDGRTMAEMAADEGVPVKTIESRLTRARAAFREAYLTFIPPDAPAGGPRREGALEPDHGT